MNYSHTFNEKTSFEARRSDRHILAYRNNSTAIARSSMLRAYPFFIAARDEHRSSHRGFWEGILALLGLLGRGRPA
jgi:hypothetical protein